MTVIGKIKDLATYSPGNKLQLDSHLEREYLIHRSVYILETISIDRQNSNIAYDQRANSAAEVRTICWQGVDSNQRTMILEYVVTYRAT